MKYQDYLLLVSFETLLFSSSLVLEVGNYRYLESQHIECTQMIQFDYLIESDCCLEDNTNMFVLWLLLLQGEIEAPYWI